MGINDDWSYIHSAFHLAQTGHIAYFGWDEPVLGWQLYWSVPFLHWFGLSFTVARFSGLLIATACTYLIHRILVRCGVTTFNATVGTLTFALSALFLPLSFSFMSDVAGFFALLLCIHLCLRSLQAATVRSASTWLTLALATNLLLGTARQVSWLGALVIVPSAYWLLKERRPPMLKALPVWLLGLCFLYTCMKWFRHQPFTQQDSLLDDIHNRQSPREIAENFLRFGLSIPLFLLPVWIGFINPAWARTRRARLAAGLALASLIVVTLAAFYVNQHHPLLDCLAPFTKNYVTAQGMINIPDIGVRPTVLGPGLRACITWLVFAASLAAAACILSKPPSDHISVTAANTLHPSGTSLFVLLAPCTFIYCSLLASRGLVGSIFDRYLLPLLVVTLLASLLLYQRYVAARLPILSVLLVVLTAGYSIAAMHDVFSMERARLAAANQLINAGNPRTAFYGGFEYDGWTQIDDWGYVQSQHLYLPAGLAHDPSSANTFKGCGYIFYRMFAAIHPRYAISFDSTACDGPSVYAPIQYRTWLPPHVGYLYTQQVVAPQSIPAPPFGSPGSRPLNQ
jgi:hypothetical protein